MLGGRGKGFIALVVITFQWEIGNKQLHCKINIMRKTYRRLRKKVRVGGVVRSYLLNRDLKEEKGCSAGKS